MKKHISTVALVAPMMFAYFVMGFMDLVGISTSYIQADFSQNYPMEVFGFLPTALFFWFLVLAIPTGILMNRIGRKSVVLLSMGFTIIGVLIPYLHYSFAACIVAFGLMGVGNTMLQVSVNPLLSNVVSGERMTSAMTVGQFCRSVCSLSGPYIALASARSLGDWKYVFLIYAVVTLAATVWLLLTPIPREQNIGRTSAAESFRLLKDPTIIMLFVAMMAFLGIDIGTNTESTQLLLWRLGLDPSNAADVASVGYAPMPYFACRIVGALIGIWVLSRFDKVRYFRLCVSLIMVSIVGLMFVNVQWAILALIGVIGFGCSSLFPIILYSAMERHPQHQNEVSGLMITAICGGAVITPLMSYAVRLADGRIGALVVLMIVALYLLATSLVLRPARR